MSNFAKLPNINPSLIFLNTISFLPNNLTPIQAPSFLS